MEFRYRFCKTYEDRTGLIARDNDNENTYRELSQKFAEGLYQLRPDLKEKHAIDITVKFEEG